MRIDLSLWVEIICLMISVVFYKKLRHSILKTLPLFLAFIVFVECYAAYVNQVMGKANYWIYNFSFPLSIGFYSYLYFHVFVKPLYRNLVLIYAGTFSLFTILNILLIQTTDRFNSYTMIFGLAGLLIYSCLYFVELVSDVKHMSILRQPFFWISTGLFFSSLISFLYWSLFELNIDNSGYLFQVLIKSGVIVRYSAFSLAVICIKNNLK